MEKTRQRRNPARIKKTKTHTPLARKVKTRLSINGESYQFGILITLTQAGHLKK